MKCIHCGANYKTKELECPYCHTPNPTGKEWLEERNRVEKKYERQKKETINKGVPYVISRIMLYTAITMIAFVVIDFMAVVGYFIKEEFTSGTFVNSAEAQRQMKEYYDAGEYLELYFYMSEHSLFGEDNYVYSQAALLTNSYHLYQGKKMSMIEQFESGVVEDDYYVSYTLTESIDIYRADVGIYDEEVPENQELYDMYREEIMSCWIGTLLLTDDEIELLSDPEVFIDYEYEQELIAKIIERSVNQ